MLLLLLVSTQKIGFVDGRYARTIASKLMIKFSTHGILKGNTKKLGLAEAIWEKKEMEEQQFVTDFILNNLKELTSEVK
jgi:isochorismate synthase